MDTGIQVLAAAYLALNQRGEGSSPSGPTENVLITLCVMGRHHAERDEYGSTRDVTAACLLAMQDVRVRFPLGALCSGRRKAWESAGFGNRKPWVQIPPS